MFASSSKRALISTRTTTCLPRSAARMSDWTIGESPEVRYSVCLMVRTSGSSAACWMNRSTDAANDSYGWWTRMSAARTAANTSAGSSSSGGTRRGRRDRRPRRGLEVRPIEVDDPVQRRQVEHAGDLVDVLRLEADAAHQQVARAGRHRPLDLEADRLAEAPAPELLLDGHEQVVGLVLLDREVGVAGDPEEVALDDLHAHEQVGQVGLDDLVDRDEPRRRRCRGAAAGSAGTLTRAKTRSPFSGSRSPTAIDRLSVEMYGNGCPGSTASGVRTG